MKTIFVIDGGGQKIRENAELGLATEYRMDEDSNYPELAKCSGVDSYTHAMWSEDLETLQRWANDWAGEKVELIKKVQQN